MSFQWTYPIYLVPLPGGYASIREEHSTDREKPLALVVYTAEELCRDFVAGIGTWIDVRLCQSS